ncbi:MAG: Gfo/Idh/MocA family oxidoreductase [Candidatus Omnitrophota bacterium]
MKNQTINRRHFLGKSAGIGAGVFAAPQIFSPKVLGANDKILMGIIGAGGRGRGVMRSLMGQGAEFIAVNDVFKPNLERGLEAAGAQAKPYDNYRMLLENKDIDAVLIGSPEHQHGVQLIDSVQAGKDAYCEKPMSNSIEEGNKMVKAVRAAKQIVQIGMQRRSSPAVHEAKKIIDDGKLGKIHLARAQWYWQHDNKPLNNSPLDGELDWKQFCYPKKEVKFEPMKYRYWRYFWVFSGGNVTDQGTHLMDVIQWFTNSGTPKEAECFGKVYETIGSETPDVFSAVYDYGDLIATWTLDYANRYQNGWTIFFQGDKGTMILDEDGYRYFEEPWEPGKAPALEYKGGIPTEPHTQNFLDCVKSRQEPNAPVEVGHKAVCGPHLSNVAWHKKRRAYLSEDATKVWT